MSDFFEKYKDPRWQKRRLEIMQLANFRCQHCDADDKTLNVHHRLYRKGANPWDYTDSELQCLCEDCHEESHQLHKSIKSCLAYLDDITCEVILGYIRAHLTAEHPDAALHIANAEQLAGVSDFCLSPKEELTLHLTDYTVTGQKLMDVRRANRRRLLQGSDRKE